MHGKTSASPTIVIVTRIDYYYKRCYPISRHSRAKPNEVAVRTASADIIGANYSTGHIHLRAKSMTNQSLTANGNEPASSGG